MKLLPLSATLSNLNADLLVVAITQKDLKSTPSGKKNIPSNKSTAVSFNTLDRSLDGSLSILLNKASFDPLKTGSSYLITLQHPQISSVLVYAVGDGFKGKHANFDENNLYRKLGSEINKSAKQVGATNVVINPENLKLDKSAYLSALVEGLYLSKYSYTTYKSKKEPTKEIKYQILGSSKLVNEAVVNQTVIACKSTSLARDLINMAPNDCTPAYLVSVARQIAANGKLKIEILDKQKLQKLGAGSLLSVSKGSALDPYLIKLSYIPSKKTKNTKVISLVGKGVTYDTGGYSLKPSESMIGMKGDMAGAACVLATLQAISQLKPNCEVRGYIPTVENMISGEATRVGDIVTAMNGTTIEILNTDAEGRLILADALTLASNEKADITIDIATLTGACVVALGLQYAGLFCDDDKLSQMIISNGELAGERFWPLPLAPEYEDSIKSKIADIKNIGNGRWAGASIGALFLKRFVKDTRWAHLDIAGPADSDTDSGFIKNGGVGFGVRTLIRLIQQLR